MDNELFGHVNTQDFIDYGFEAEFVGRLPIRVVCEHLGSKDLLEIMESSEEVSFDNISKNLLLTVSKLSLIEML